MFSSKAEGAVKVLKRSFLSFKQPNIDFMQLCCLLNGIMCVLNSRPISLHRSQTLHSPLNLVTAHNLMFACSKPTRTYHIMQPCDDARMQSDTFIRRQLQHHASRLFILYAKYLLESYHKSLQSKPQNFDYRKLAPNIPILFNSQPTGSKYSYNTFRFAVVDELRYGRKNNDYPRTIIVRTLDRGKVIRRSVRPEDCMLLRTEGHIGNISSEEILKLES